MRLVALLLTLAAAASTAWAQLPPQMEADRQMLLAKNALDANRNQDAVDAFEKVLQIKGVQLPDTFDFHYARALMGAQRYDDAGKRYGSYLKSAGTAGKFYAEALAGYNDADRQRQIALKQRQDAELAEILKARKREDAQHQYEDALAQYQRDYAEYQEESRKRLERVAKCEATVQADYEACYAKSQSGKFFVDWEKTTANRRWCSENFDTSGCDRRIKSIPAPKKPQKPATD